MSNSNSNRAANAQRASGDEPEQAAPEQAAAAPVRPAVAAAAERATPTVRTASRAEEGAIATSRLRRQEAAEREAIDNAKERAESQDSQQDREAAEVAVQAAAEAEALHKQLTAPDLTNASVILDANTLKAQRIARTKALAPKLRMDVARPGGDYIVNGKRVDANGRPIVDQPRLTPAPAPTLPEDQAE